MIVALNKIVNVIPYLFKMAFENVYRIRWYVKPNFDIIEDSVLPFSSLF
jgi:hypothetical protein